MKPYPAHNTLGNLWYYSLGCSPFSFTFDNLCAALFPWQCSSKLLKAGTLIGSAIEWNNLSSMNRTVQQNALYIFRKDSLACQALIPCMGLPFSIKTLKKWQEDELSGGWEKFFTFPQRLRVKKLESVDSPCLCFVSSQRLASPTQWPPPGRVYFAALWGHESFVLTSVLTEVSLMFDPKCLREGEVSVVERFYLLLR